MKSLWGRKVSDLAFADFVKKLVYIAKKKGVKIVFIDKKWSERQTQREGTGDDREDARNLSIP